MSALIRRVRAALARANPFGGARGPCGRRFCANSCGRGGCDLSGRSAPTSEQSG